MWTYQTQLFNIVNINCGSGPRYHVAQQATPHSSVHLPGGCIAECVGELLAINMEIQTHLVLMHMEQLIHTMSMELV